MAKATKAEKQASEETKPEASEAAAPAAKPSKVIAEIGDKVFFHRDVNTGNGLKLIPQVAFLTKVAAKESNLPENSFDLAILTNVFETRFGVMFSEEPKGGFWSYKKA